MTTNRKACDDARLEQRLKDAYMTGLRHVHEGGRVEIHLGSAVVDHLKALAEDVTAKITHPLGSIGATCWGFPVVPVENNPAHIAIHVVHDIF